MTNSRHPCRPLDELTFWQHQLAAMTVAVTGSCSPSCITMLMVLEGFCSDAVAGSAIVLTGFSIQWLFS